MTQVWRYKRKLVLFNTRELSRVPSIDKSTLYIYIYISDILEETKCIAA